MEKIPKGVYTQEFKEEAVKLVTEGGLTIPEAARRLSISKSTIEYWVRQAKNDNLSIRRKGVTAEEMELNRLRRENAELKMERDILKNPPQGSRLSL